MKLRFDKHFYDRYRKRVDARLTDKQIRRKVVGRFMSGIRKGLKTNERGNLKLYLYPSIIALIEVKAEGYYIAFTVIYNKEVK